MSAHAYRAQRVPDWTRQWAATCTRCGKGIRASSIIDVHAFFNRESCRAPLSIPSEGGEGEG